METAAFSEEARAKREEENNRIWINKLPNEILSRIFIIGEEMDQADDNEANDEDSNDEEGPDIEFQELVTQVCRRWRTVAVNTPMLWTYITLSKPTPHRRARAALFLERSGSTIPLEVEIDITESSFNPDNEEFDSELQARLVCEALEFIVSHGGRPSRWARLAVWFDTSSAMFAVIDFIASAALDNLRKLSLVNTFVDPLLAEDLATEALRKRDLGESVMFKTPPPIFHELELVGIPSNFFFAHEGRPLVSNLTHLDLGSLVSLPPLTGLRDLFLNSPQLESLCLDMGMIETTDFQSEPPASIRVNLSRLRRLSLQEPISVTWGLSVLQMIDAPRLEGLSLNLNQSQVAADPIPLYVAYGRTNGHLVDEVPHEQEDKRGPIYPALKQLALGPFSGSLLSLQALLTSSKTITRLDWELEYNSLISIKILVDPALSTESPCPRLEHLRVYGVSGEELLYVVNGRKRLKIPLKTVEVNSRDWDHIGESTKVLLRKELPKFGQYIDDNESDSDSESDDDEWSDVETNTSASDGADDDDSTDSTSDEDPEGALHGSSDEWESTDDDSETDE